MYFYNLIKDLSKDKELVIFCDMDGVIAAFDFGKTLHSNYNFLQIDWHEDGIIKAE